MQSGYVTSQALKLYYEIEGEGLPVVLLNGGPGFPLIEEPDKFFHVMREFLLA